MKAGAKISFPKKKSLSDRESDLRDSTCEVDTDEWIIKKLKEEVKILKADKIELNDQLYNCKLAKEGYKNSYTAEIDKKKKLLGELLLMKGIK